MAGTSPVTPDDVVRAQALLRRLLDQLGRVVLGQEGAVRELLIALTARGHVLLEGVPGTAKTLLCACSASAPVSISGGSSSPPT